MAYEDVETSYDSAFDKLVADAFPSSEQSWGDWLSGSIGLDNASITEEAFNRGEEYLHEISPEGMGTFIETMLGNDLTALQQDPARAEEYQRLVDLVTEIRPDNADELLRVYKEVATPETYTAVVLAQAGVNQETIESFTQRLRDEPEVRERMIELIDRLESSPAMAGDIESLSERIAENGTILRAIAENPDNFFELAGTDAFETMFNHVSSHVAAGGTLDSQGVMDMVAGISLQDKATMFMQMGGASAEDIAEFQTTLNTALEINPELETVINTAITNAIREAGTGDGTGNVFETLKNASETFAEYANSQAARTVLTDPGIVNTIVAEARAHGEGLSLEQLRDAGIESVIYEEAGRMFAINGSNLSPATLMFGGHAINTSVEMARRLGDGESASQINVLMEQFRGMIGGERGLGQGFLGGLGNTPGFLGDAMGPIVSRYGDIELSPTQSAFAQMDRAYIFDGSNGYPAVDYAQIARNHANNTWDANGNIRPESERGMDLTTRMTQDGMRIVEASTGMDVNATLATAGEVAEGVIQDGAGVLDQVRGTTDPEVDTGGVTPTLPTGPGR